MLKLHAGILLILFLINTGIIHAESSALKIDKKGNLILPEHMKAALKAFNPDFTAWKASDYSIRAREASEGEKAIIAPFALAIDVNKDGREDLILDGHDKKQSLLLGLISKQERYETKIIQENALVDPRIIKDWDSGVQDTGLSHFFVLPEKPHGKVAFTIGYPQLSGPDGELLNDGGIVDFIFQEGEFRRYHQPL